MDMHYSIIYDKKFERDLKIIELYLTHYQLKKVKQQINKDILDLEYMPRIHKTLYSVKDPNGEYRRIVSGNYIIIYKIEDKNIIILRIFSHKQDYLNPRNFILREESSIYNITK